jgi:cephalosporin hydroxylase
VRREYVAARNMLRANAAVWTPAFWTSLTHARAAQRRGAMQKLREFAPLVALVGSGAPRVVVEIGTASGGTFYAWCRAAAPDATLVSIDLPGGRFGGEAGPADVATLRGYGRPAQELHFLRADSHDLKTRARLEEILDGRAIDFLMIDGDHTYDGVKRDFELYEPLVGAGKPVAFHDIVLHPDAPACQVDRFWNEIKGGRRYVEFVDGHAADQYGGIGVLYSEGGDRRSRDRRRRQRSIASR